MSGPTKLRTQELAGTSRIPSRLVCRRIRNKDSITPPQTRTTEPERQDGRDLTYVLVTFPIVVIRIPDKMLLISQWNGLALGCLV